MNELDKLLQVLKGGKGSGNFGHSGRPGQRGGSSSGASISYDYNGIKFEGKPTMGEFIVLYRWDHSNVDTGSIPVFLNEKDLPPIKSGNQRLAHGTNIKNVTSISKNGLRTGREVGSKEKLPVILAVKGAKSSFGEASFVFDLPKKDKSMRAVNPEWVEVSRMIKPSEMKGIVLSKSAADVTELGKMIPAYKKRYGELMW